VDRKRAGKLLLVEDEHVLRELVAQFLRGDGYEVLEAGDGQAAVDVYSSCRPFDVVLLDLNLPILCGIEVCRRIKSANPGQPVLICSAAILDPDVEVLRTLQVDRFLTKPYHPLDLLAAIDSALRESALVHVGRGHSAHGAAACLHRSPAGSIRPVDSELPASQTLVK
jgi:DNA-binding response OmpR family regulator